MKLTVAIYLIATIFADLSAAFYPYIPFGQHGATKTKRPARRTTKDSDTGLPKMRLHRRIVPAGLRPRSIPKLASSSDSKDLGELLKRANDFQVDFSETPTFPQSAAVDEDDGDMSYFCEVMLGANPGETVYLLMDTGSSAAWVMGQGCTSAACESHSTFGSSNSKTLVQGSETFNLSYNTGQVAGPIVTDTVSFGGVKVKMQFGTALEADNTFDNYPMDGILGLAREPGDGFSQPSFIQVLQQSKALKSNIFGINLQRAADNSNDGEISFGGIDKSRFQGDLNYLDTVGEKNLWEIPVDGFSVDGQLSSLGSRNAVIDSGTSYIFLPPDDAAALYKLIPEAKFAKDDTSTIPCDTNVEISLIFNKVTYNISPKDYVGPPTSSGQCQSNIFSQVAIDEQTWLIGDTFLKNVYTVFDMDQNRIGFGAKGTLSSSSVSSPSSTTTGSTSGSSAASTVTASSSARPTAIQPQMPGSSGPAAQVSSTASPAASSTGNAQGDSSAATVDRPVPFLLATLVSSLLILLGI